MEPGKIEIRLRWRRRLEDRERANLQEFLWAFGIDPWLLDPERVDDEEDYGMVNVVTQRRKLGEGNPRSPWMAMIERNRELAEKVISLEARLAAIKAGAPGLDGEGI